jgi:hypothetical protein
MVDAGAVGTARWDTLAVTGPVETTDACGRTSFEYRAELPL